MKSDPQCGAESPRTVGPRLLARERLDTVALRHFGEHGLHGASLAHIAEELGITRQALAKRFGSKEGLFRSILMRRAGNFRRLSISSLAGSPEEVLRVYAREMLSPMVSEEGLTILRAYYGGLYRFPEIARAEREAVEQMALEVGAFLSGVARALGAPERDWVDAGRAFLAMVMGLMLPAIAGAALPAPDDLERSIRRLVERLLRGEGLFTGS